MEMPKRYGCGFNCGAELSFTPTFQARKQLGRYCGLSNYRADKVTKS